jgi:T5SS/PEP-CTERM-associated repeat protein
VVLAPDRTDDVYFTTSGSVITGTGAAADVLFAGDGGWNLTSGASLTVSGRLADDVGVVVGTEVNGVTQPANLLITDGANLVETGGASAVIASQFGAGGSSVDVTGAGSDWQISGGLVIGIDAAGALNITAGGTVSAATIELGAYQDSGGAGTLSINGDNSSLVVTGSVALGGYLSSGELSVLGAANAFIGGDLDFGQSGNGSSGIIDLETTGTVTVNGALNFGAPGGAGGPAVLTLGPNTTLALSGGINGNPGGQLNLFTTIDLAPYSDNSTDNISGAFHPVQTQDYPTYVAATAFNLSDGVTYTLDTPVIYDGSSFIGSSFTIGGSGDTTHNELILNADTFSADSSVTFNNALGTLEIGKDTLGTIDVPASGTGPFTTEANPNLGLLLLGDFDGTIGGFQSGDQILVDTGLASASDGTLSQNGALVSVIDIGNGDTLGVLTFDSATNAAAAIADNAIVLEGAPCFATGTRIATERDEVAVEAIRVGDQVRVLLGDGFSEVIWVGRREVDCAGHAQPRKLWPVRIAAGAFGPSRPHSELFLSPDHAVYINDVLIPIKHLINGSTIVQVPVERVTYHHIELAQHNVLLAEGLPAESFLDMRDGSNYANRPGPIRLYPDFSARMWEAFGCARLVVTGPELSAARAMVAGLASVQKAA